MALNDRELLAKTLQAEAGNQGIGGMLAVGSVIRNRMAQGGSLSDVILAPAQFSAWNKVTGAVGGEQGQDMAALKPSEDAYAAADAILSGNAPDVTGGATHYYNPSISNPAWGKEKAGGDWTKIGAHIFGKAGDFRTGAAKMNGEQTQKPQGLLGGLLGGQGIGGALGMSDDLRDRLAMGIMAGSDPRQFAPLIQQRAASMQDRRDKRDAQAKANVTASYIEGLGDKKLAELVRGGGISGAAALTAVTKGDKKFVDIEKYKLAQAQGYKGTFIDFTKDLAQIEKTGEVPAGLEAMNKKFGEELIDLDLVGLGEARFRTAKIKTVLDQLEAGEDLTGPLQAVIGELGRSIYSPKSQQAKDLVESVIQTSLRETLGGQFAQKEGEALIKRAYNIALPPEENAARLRALLAQLEASAASKTAMAEYYRENNFSLAGYKGSKYTPTVEDLYSAIDSASAEFKSGGADAGVNQSQTLSDEDLLKKYGG